MKWRFPALMPSGRLRRPVRRIIAVQAGPNPSFDYYLGPRLRRFGKMPYEIVDIDRVPSLLDAERLDGTLILFCRYLTAAWLDLIEARGGILAGVALFLDDDIDALFADRSVPADYKLRLLRLHLSHRRRLASCLDLLYVANPRIAERDSLAELRLLSPMSGPRDEPRSREPQIGLRVAFHSTSVHRGEHRWLRPVLRDALKAEPGITAEVAAGLRLRLLWRGQRGIRFLRSRSWPDFRRDTAERGADLLLAPLLPSPANAARAATKRIDAMRLGAALLVSDAEIYKPNAEELALGMCVPIEPGRWSQALVALAHDRPRLERLRDLNRAHVETMNARAEPLLRPKELAGLNL
ncbi:hypothetical protein SAMN05216548_104103 [Faunimonas pinastri]|uniref:Glycosyltransferase family 1 protein n=1 Tax=Faunimonas pinastri TaxID=1855383 RepID=A0A1H9FFH9_9HYPH|nr:hypothetical protein [Faunimonas pinastri]SEQ36684.1 hypothetical protein SAMN05216548_104103 [Faunimonas pinastri]